MEVETGFVCYELNSLLGSKDNLVLKKLTFGPYRNWFETKEDAIKALFESERTYEDYVILEQVYITNY